MKRIRLYRHLALLIIITFILSILLTACSSDKTKDAGSTVSGTPTSAPTAAPTAAADNTAGQAGTQADSTQTGQETAQTDNSWPVDFSLYKAYENDFMIGTVYNPTSLNGKDKEFTLKQFNAITPENLMKPQYMQPTEGNFNFMDSGQMVKFGEENNLYLIGHTLAWHQQSGSWLGRNVTRDQAIEQLKSHITTIVSKYKGKFYSFDVVNEAINDGVSLPADGDWTKCLRNTQWLSSIGPDYIEMAFKFAHDADPDLKLYYNDYNLNDKRKADIVYAMVKDFKSRGIPIDGIGMQGHYNSATPVDTVDNSLKMFSELGVEVSITELDVTARGVEASGFTKEIEVEQAIEYAKLFQVFKKYKDIIARVTFWGYLDNRSWRKESYPCLFNADYSPKQAAYAVLDPDKYLELNAPKGEASLAKEAQARFGTPVIDGAIDDVWNNCTAIDVNNAIMAWQGATGKVRLLWDNDFVYALFEVKDSVLNKQSQNAYEQDSVELFLDQNNGKTSYYEEDDGQYRVNYEGTATFGTVPAKEGFKSSAVKTADGYLVEMAIPLMKAGSADQIMGFDAQVNDSNASGMRQSIMKYNDMTDNSYQTTAGWGSLKLVK